MNSPTVFSKWIRAACVAAAMPLSFHAADGAEAVSRPGPAAQVATPPKAENFDLYLLVGQSNMSGRGRVTPADSQPDTRVLVLGKDGEWLLQGEPVHFDTRNAAVGLGFAFAKRMADHSPGVTIGLIPCAVGATPQKRWMPGGDLYEEAVRRAGIAQQSGRLRGILWHQGESETGSLVRSKAYGENLAKIVEGFRRDLNAPGVPFVAGELGEFLYMKSEERAANAKIVNEQINRLPALVPNTAVIPSAGLGHRGDGTHFNAEAQREFGRRYYEAMVALRKKTTTTQKVAHDSGILMESD